MVLDSNRFGFFFLALLAAKIAKILDREIHFRIQLHIKQ